MSELAYKNECAVCHGKIAVGERVLLVTLVETTNEWAYGWYFEKNQYLRAKFITHKKPRGLVHVQCIKNLNTETLL